MILSVTRCERNFIKNWIAKRAKVGLSLYRTGRIIRWSLLYYLLSMILAVILGIALVFIIRPGRSRPFAANNFANCNSNVTATYGSSDFIMMHFGSISSICFLPLFGATSCELFYIILAMVQGSHTCGQVSSRFIAQHWT